MGYGHDQSDDTFFDKEFYCDICSKWFDKKSDMTIHREETPEQNSYWKPILQLVKKLL